MKKALSLLAVSILLTTRSPALAQPEQLAEPEAELPQTELLTAEPPAAEQPEADQPTPESPEAEAPEAEASNAESPEAETSAAEQGRVGQTANTPPAIRRHEITPPVEPPRIAAPATLSSAFVLPGIYISHNTRVGYRKYDGVNGYQRLDNAAVVMLGGAAGKRFALRNPMLRAQVTAETGWGSVLADHIDLETVNHETVKGDLYENFLIGAVLGEIHYLFPSDNGRNYFLSAGPGAHVASYYETAKVGSQKVVESNWLVMASLNFNIGAGMEYMISQNRAVSISYNLRLWEPVHYVETGELFPMGVDYREVFFTHTVRVQLLLPRFRYKKFHDR